jgi:predicted TPR repeat methyltransferase
VGNLPLHSLRTGHHDVASRSFRFLLPSDLETRDHPAVAPDVLLTPVAEGYVAYSTATDRLYRLNPVAALIAELCNGQRSVESIQNLVAPLLPEGRQSEVDHWIAKAIQDGLLINSTEAKSRPSVLDSDQLTELAGRLRKHGKTETAFLCQQQAATLDPDDPWKWKALGEMAHILGRRGDARYAYERLLEIRPDNAEIRHLLIALRDESPPERVPDECIQQLYARFSAFYESQMRDELGYEGPERLLKAIRDVVGDHQIPSVLELGCGTGLFGQLLKPRALRLLGVDLSPEMVAVAAERDLYDQVEVAEITRWLDDCRETFDLIVACDTLIYFGDLRQVVCRAVKHLRPGGAIAFSVERTASAPFRLTDSGRYAHHSDHLRQVAESTGLSVACLREEYMRMEYGEEVIGLFVVLVSLNPLHPD